MSEELKERIKTDEFEEDNESVDLGNFSLSLVVREKDLCFDIHSLNFDMGEIIIEVPADEVYNLFTRQQFRIISINCKKNKIDFEKDSYIKSIQKSNSVSNLFHCTITYII